MSPQLAAITCAAFVFYLFWAEKKSTEGASLALWIPLAWMFLAGSRYVSDWLNLRATMDAIDAQRDGSPVDRVVFSALILMGATVLIKRRLALGRLIARNKWICLYFLFAVVSIGWSDYPFVSFKRLIRGLGNAVMALVILTDPQPYVATGVVLRRLAFLTLPLSVVFIKYYPELGRAYHMGTPMFTGVAQHKNALGQLCLLTGISFCWGFLYSTGPRLTLAGRLRIPVEIVFLALIVWLMNIADSATSLLALVVSGCILFLGRVPVVARAPRRVFGLVLASVLFLALLQTAFDLRGALIESLGRRPDLTTRVPMWEDLLSVAPNPMIGAGYDIFWATEAGVRMSERWSVGQAHNGYLELYLSLGIIGVVIMAGCLLSGLLRIRSDLAVDYAPAVLRLCIVPIVVMYNWTEATFNGVSNMWLVLFIGIMDARGLVSPARASLGEEPRKSGDSVPVGVPRFRLAHGALPGRGVASVRVGRTTAL